MTRRTVVAGASRGIGAAVAGHYAGRGDEIIALSRGKPPHGRWLACDLADPAQIAALPGRIDGPVDALLYTGGVWEAGAFTDAYRFAASPAEETARVLAVNLTAPILLTQALLPLMSPGARVILVGSLTAMDNTATPEVANSASKYGLRGAAQALALTLHPKGIGVTVINPGNVATGEVLADIAAGRFPDQTPIPMADLMAAFDFALDLSPASVAREIDLAQMRG
jgi:NAD(P)-dependent dehydrogenase (short-subunit alcohol dehydrogenase family)